MKKLYQKPAIEVEDFILDVEIASKDPSYDACVYAFYLANGRYPDSDAELQEFIRTSYIGDANDGWCYFTAYIPS